MVRARLLFQLPGAAPQQFSRLDWACRLCQLVEATMIELPFVIAVFMVRHWLGPEAVHEDVVGRMTGLLVSQYLLWMCQIHSKPGSMC